MSSKTPLPGLALKLRETYGHSVPGGYRRLLALASDGALPITRVGGRIFVDDDRIPEIAEMLGLAREAPHAA